MFIYSYCYVYSVLGILFHCFVLRIVCLKMRTVLLPPEPGLAQWLRHCATSRAVPGSNPGGVSHRDFSRGYRQNHVPWG